MAGRREGASWNPGVVRCQGPAGDRHSPSVTLALIVFVVFLAPWWSMLRKAGHSGALALLLFIPYVNVAFVLWFAFAKWPVQRELEALKAARAASTAAPRQTG
ncbi:MAG: hypothetical protein QM704_14535 [Anaeromyxobacteraceae bacterium]